MDEFTMFLDGCTLLLKQGWRPFVEVTIPGIGVSPATLAFGVLLAGFSIRVLSVMLGSHVFLPSVSAPSSVKDKPGSIRNDPNYFMS